MNIVKIRKEDKDIVQDIKYLDKEYFRSGGGGGGNPTTKLAYTTYRRNLRGRLKEQIFVSDQTNKFIMQKTSNLGFTGTEGIEIIFLN